jgi:hypothetical protein
VQGRVFVISGLPVGVGCALATVWRRHGFASRVAQSWSMTSFYEFVGGDETLHRLEELFYEKDPSVLSR